MAITRVKVSNFKSFDELEVELRPLNVVVGANAAGKSNFLEIFRFVRDLAVHGLENAVSLQGGIEYLANLRIGASRPVTLEATFDVPQTFMVKADSPTDIWFALVSQSLYRITLGVERDRPGLEVLDDEVIHTCRFETIREARQVRIGEGQLIVTRRDGRVHLAPELSSVADAFLGELTGDLSLSLALLGPPDLAPHETLIERRFAQLPYIPESIALFDLDPKLPKKAAPVTGKADLEPDGSNLAIVLRNVLQDEEKRRTFVRLLKDALPFVDDLKVERFADKSLLIALKERFADQGYLPASFLSDGTIHLTALILALYFEKAAVTIIEEPERNIHPHLISKLVGMMADAARHKQVLVTTHNPELVKHAALDDLLLVHRDEQGFSRVSRPAESRELKVFLENDLGVDELYVQNLLGVGHGV